ncbi:hypothetical protein K432DRAFT_395823 [Lepidopterella palustris CBS 459.81]|uniref:Uncharacterized protein n=1 Tax=Lepidopterella palustris CBS 459.81 TaxID=1314670 RepID=A0A8E2E4T4_9PEZI|nr:hypothetical protein K432DRAFT_395823 [Lepidopterella palustris CBS 459.81]
MRSVGFQPLVAMPVSLIVDSSNVMGLLTAGYVRITEYQVIGSFCHFTKGSHVFQLARIIWRIHRCFFFFFETYPHFYSTSNGKRKRARNSGDEPIPKKRVKDAGDKKAKTSRNTIPGRKRGRPRKVLNWKATTVAEAPRWQAVNANITGSNIPLQNASTAPVEEPEEQVVSEKRSSTQREDLILALDLGNSQS